MSPDELERARELYAAIRRLPAASRSASLERACRDQPSIRAAVEAMLAAEQLPDAGGDSSDAPPIPNTVMPDATAPVAQAASTDRTAPPDAPSHPNLVPPGYAYLQTLGEGGQGVVMLATQASTGRRVAIKVLHGASHASTAVAQRFEREVRVLAALDHPNIVSIIDRGTLASGAPFLVMEFISGIPLQTWITRTHAAPASNRAIGASVQLFLKICDAVNVAHVRGITHRDLKPANILVDERDEPQILDFGLALVSVDTAADPLSPISMTGQFMGSLPWASPEQANCQSDKVDARSDVYSLGVILFQIVTGGRFPYAVAGTMKEVLDNIITANPPAPSSIASQPPTRVVRLLRWHQGAGVNREMDAIVLKALSKRRDDRYQNAGELGRDIARYLAGKPTAASANADADQRKHRGLVAVIAALLVAGVAVAVYVSMRHAERPTVVVSPTTRHVVATEPATARSPDPSTRPSPDATVALRTPSTAPSVAMLNAVKPSPPPRPATTQTAPQELAPTTVAATPRSEPPDRPVARANPNSTPNRTAPTDPLALGTPLQSVDWTTEPDDPARTSVAGYVAFRGGHLAHNAVGNAQLDVASVNGNFIFETAGSCDHGTWAVAIHDDQRHGVCVGLTQGRTLIVAPTWYDIATHIRANLPLSAPVGPRPAGQVVDRLTLRKDRSTLTLSVNGQRIGVPVSIGPDLGPNQSIAIYSAAAHGPVLSLYDGFSLWGTDETSVRQSLAARAANARRRAVELFPGARMVGRPASMPSPEWAATAALDRLGPPSHAADWTGRPDDPMATRIDGFTGIRAGRMMVGTGSTAELQVSPADNDFVLDLSGTSARGAWGFAIHDYANHGYEVVVTNERCVVVAPTPYDIDAARRTALPIVFPMPPLRGPRTVDRLTVRKLGSHLEICLNGEQVCDPLDVGPDIARPQFAVSASSEDTKPCFAAFERFRMWAAPHDAGK